MADQARIRKERREAKIRAGGSARLDKITGLGGGIRRDPPQQEQQQAQLSADPDEVDISQHYYEPSRPPRPPGDLPTDAQLRQMMLGFDPSSSPAPTTTSPPGPNPFNLPFDPSTSNGEDPAAKLLSSLLSGTSPAAPAQTSTPAWRILHALAALSLGLAIALTTPFTGASRLDPSSAAASARFFWAFAAAELALHGARAMLDGAPAPPPGVLGGLLGFLPEPWRGYVGLGTRYVRIWTAVTGDAMVVVFVLGVCAWWRDGVAGG